MHTSRPSDREPLNGSAGRAPYASYDSVRKIIELIAQGEIEGLISRSALADRGMSPFNQVVLVQALQTMGLTDAEGRPTDRLQRCLIDDQHRREETRSWALEFYAAILDLARQDASALEIQDEFATFGYRGNTLRKAMAFYLACAADVDLPVSSRFADIGQRPKAASRQHRYGPTNGPGPQDPSTAWAGRSGSVTPAAVTDQELSRSGSVGEKSVVDLGGFGRITIFADVRWFELPSAETARLQDLMRGLHAFAGEVRAHQSEADVPVFSEG